jgi:hypothetical protein
MSIKKNVTGYNNLILLIPVRDKNNFDTSNLPDRTLIHYVDDSGNGYLKQQVLKLQAYKYSFADYIMFSDSDVIFDHSINLQDFVSDDKPEILYTHYDKVESAFIWKKPTEDFLKEPVDFEFMRRNNLIYHRSTLENISNYEGNLEYIVMNSERFSEFNLMGAYAFKFEKEKYNFINTDEWAYTEPKGIQLWGWAENGSKDATHVYEYQRTLDVLNKVFELNLTRI